MTKVCKDGRIWGQTNKQAGNHLGIPVRNIENHKSYYLRHRAEIIQRNKEYNRLHKQARTEHYWQYRAQLKSEVLTHYGNGKLACVKCGYDKHLAALSLDHVNSSGAEHRRIVGTGGGRPFYVWLKNNGFPEGYQTLCMNCQFIKKFEDREYGSINKKGDK